ncbi:MAG TPA: DUF1553 domain-containing protein, partial [Pirellulaceae bacterium]|nr:DUF1553 domain-containing protein [Pirellulaceae bacterium]
RTKSGTGDGAKVIFAAENGDINQPLRGRPQPPKPLDGAPLPLDSTADRRQVLADWLTSPQNPYFTRSIANRIWANFFGVGIIEKVDDLRVTNPASNEELLTAVAQHLSQQHHDLKALMRTLLQSETYQRSSAIAAGTPAPPVESYRTANERRLSAEQLLRCVLIATGPRDAAPAAAPAPAPAPAGEAPKSDAPKNDASDDPAKPDVEKLRAAFVKAFANSPMDPEVDFAPSLKSALFVLNDAAVLDRLQRTPGNLVDRLMKKGEAGDAAGVADELYLSVLVRRPTDEERQAVAEYLSQNEARRANAITNLTWSLLASTEFCLNH